MTNYRIMLFIIGFWLILPIPFIFMGVGGYDNLKDSFNNMEKYNVKPTISTYLGLMLDGIFLYFKIIFFWVSDCPLFVNVFLWILKIMSGLILFVFIRG